MEFHEHDQKRKACLILPANVIISTVSRNPNSTLEKSRLMYRKKRNCIAIKNTGPGGGTVHIERVAKISEKVRERMELRRLILKTASESPLKLISKERSVSNLPNSGPKPAIEFNTPVYSNIPANEDNYLMHQHQEKTIFQDLYPNLPHSPVMRRTNHSHDVQEFKSNRGPAIHRFKGSSTMFPEQIKNIYTNCHNNEQMVRYNHIPNARKNLYSNIYNHSLSETKTNRKPMLQLGRLDGQCNDSGNSGYFSQDFSTQSSVFNVGAAAQSTPKTIRLKGGKTAFKSSRMFNNPSVISSHSTNLQKNLHPNLIASTFLPSLAKENTAVTPRMLPPRDSDINLSPKFDSRNQQELDIQKLSKSAIVSSESSLQPFSEYPLLEDTMPNSAGETSCIENQCFPVDISLNKMFELNEGCDDKQSPLFANENLDDYSQALLDGSNDKNNSYPKEALDRLSPSAIANEKVIKNKLNVSTDKCHSRTNVCASTKLNPDVTLLDENLRDEINQSKFPTVSSSMEKPKITRPLDETVSSQSIVESSHKETIEDIYLENIALNASGFGTQKGRQRSKKVNYSQRYDNVSSKNRIKKTSTSVVEKQPLLNDGKSVMLMKTPEILSNDDSKQPIKSPPTGVSSKNSVAESRPVRSARKRKFYDAAPIQLTRSQRSNKKDRKSSQRETIDTNKNILSETGSTNNSINTISKSSKAPALQLDSNSNNTSECSPASNKTPSSCKKSNRTIKEGLGKDKVNNISDDGKKPLNTQTPLVEISKKRKRGRPSTKSHDLSIKNPRRKRKLSNEEEKKAGVVHKKIDSTEQPRSSIVSLELSSNKDKVVNCEDKCELPSKSETPFLDTFSSAIIEDQLNIDIKPVTSSDCLTSEYAPEIACAASDQEKTFTEAIKCESTVCSPVYDSTDKSVMNDELVKVPMSPGSERHSLNQEQSNLEVEAIKPDSSSTVLNSLESTCKELSSNEFEIHSEAYSEKKPCISNYVASSDETQVTGSTNEVSFPSTSSLLSSKESPVKDSTENDKSVIIPNIIPESGSEISHTGNSPAAQNSSYKLEIESPSKHFPVLNTSCETMEAASSSNPTKLDVPCIEKNSSIDAKVEECKKVSKDSSTILLKKETPMQSLDVALKPVGQPLKPWKFKLSSKKRNK